MLKKVEDKFAFRANEYYLSLINWDNPEDPIKRIIIPSQEELENWGDLDASDEADYSVVPGLQHKYDQTAVLLVSDNCGGFCRFCFRKRLFLEGNREVIRDFSRDLDYIRENPEITNILISGGDPLSLTTEKIADILQQVQEIDHIRIIRIGTKMPAYNPYRIIDDPALCDTLAKFRCEDRRIYIMTQFNHPTELSDPAIEGLSRLQDAGAILANQTPLLKGVNDKPEILAQLLRKLSFIGNAPYYVFQCRPTLGNRHFALPIEKAYRIFEDAKTQCSGLAKRPRFVMSHNTGKIEMISMDDEMMYFKYHQAALPENIGKFVAFRRNPEAYWFDDYLTKDKAQSTL